MRIASLVLLSSFVSWNSFAASLEFVGRCELSSPPLTISLDGDPRQLVTCHMRNGETFLHMNQKVQLKIGSESYPARDEWPGYGQNCTLALKSFKDYPELQILDPVSGVSIHVSLDRDYKDLTVAFGLRRDACRGKAKAPSDAESI